MLQCSFRESGSRDERISLEMTLTDTHHQNKTSCSTEAGILVSNAILHLMAVISESEAASDSQAVELDMSK